MMCPTLIAVSLAATPMALDPEEQVKPAQTQPAPEEAELPVEIINEPVTEVEWEVMGEEAIVEAADTAVEPEPEAPLIDQGLVDAANAYLNELESIEGRFLQINPDGSAYEGDLYLDRPGKARFEYDEYPLLIVSDGRTVAQQDKALDVIDRIALRSTPLYYLLKEELDLSEDAQVAAAGLAQGQSYVSLQDPNDEFDGLLTLYFSGASLELREWVATDAMGYQTRFVLTELNRARDLDPRLFILDEEEDDRRGRR